MSAESYLKEIHSIDAEIKRLNAHIKILRDQKRRTQSNLHRYMTSHELEKVGEGKESITLAKCAPPKPRRKAKPKKNKRCDAIDLFREAGIPNPDEFYKQFESTQKSSQDVSEDSSRSSSKNQKGDIDDMLGF